jgi:hypothetical protein
LRSSRSSSSRSRSQVYLALTREGIPTPGSGKHWDRTFFRARILDDVYKPHSYEEVAELVSPEVAAQLDPEKRYGIWWFNRRRKRTRQVCVASENGRRYKTEQRATPKPKEGWIAVPVPDSGIPRKVVDAAGTLSGTTPHRRPRDGASGNSPAA